MFYVFLYCKNNTREIAMYASLDCVFVIERMLLRPCCYLSSSDFTLVSQIIRIKKLVEHISFSFYISIKPSHTFYLKK